MKNTHKKHAEDVWENRSLGASSRHVRKVSAKREKAIDETLGLQMISIRLQKNLVDRLKKLALTAGIGYQPYIRQLLTGHVNEKSGLLNGRRVVKARRVHRGDKN